MNDATSVFNRKSNRRKFLKNGMLAAGAATVGAGLLPGKLSAFGRDNDDQDDRAPITKGDIAILTFLSASSKLKKISGCSIPSSAACKTTKFQASTAEIRSIPPL